MSKEEFLKQLQERIRILQPSEQQDILDEYAQHIQMRMEGGLSEEEAIRDFGSLDDLVAQILEAYHISPDWQDRIKAPSPTVKEAMAAGVGWIERVRQKAQSVWGNFRSWLSGKWNRIKTALHREKQPVQPKPPKEESHTFGNWLKNTNRKFWSLMGALFAWCLRTAKVLCRWAWNAALLCAAVPVFCAAGFFLICAGTLTVLLVQGYPVVGLLLGSVGLVLCGGGVLVFALTLIWRKPANGNKEVPDHA